MGRPRRLQRLVFVAATKNEEGKGLRARCGFVVRSSFPKGGGGASFIRFPVPAKHFVPGMREEFKEMECTGFWRNDC